VATNYGQFLQFKDNVTAGIVSRPIDVTNSNAPYRFSGDLDVPEGEVLTRTHCSGYCREDERGDCSVSDFSTPLNKMANFFISCSSGIKWTPRTGDTVVHYNPYRVKKIVMQMRNPFGIVLSRYKRFQEKRGEFQTVVGFHEYCKYHDDLYGSKYKEGLYTQAEMDASEGVQCHGEFYRVINWYNKAYEVADFLQIEPLDYYFEDYFTDLEGTTTNLMNFINLPQNPTCELPFDGKYEHVTETLLYWETLGETATFNFMNVMASDRVKTSFERYFLQ